MQLTNSKAQKGFILLEVLVAMGLILGVWMTSIGAYQGLVLRWSQQESKRSQLRQVFDVYELTEQDRVNKIQINLPNVSNIPNISSKDIKNESSRVSGRNRSLYPATKSTFKN